MLFLAGAGGDGIDSSESEAGQEGGPASVQSLRILLAMKA